MRALDGPSLRDRGVVALIEGFFAAGWFSWAGSGADARLNGWLVAGSIVGTVLAVVGAVVAVRHRADPAALSDQPTRRRYGIIVGIEFGVAAAGAVLLGVTGQGAYIPVWVCAVVGVHFVALAPVFGDRRMVLQGALLTALAVAGLVVGLASAVAPGVVVGTGAGVVLVAFGGAVLLGGLDRHAPSGTAVSA